MRWWAFPILVALAGSSHLECQESSKVSYDGQRVAAVDLVANPKISVDSLRPLIQQKADEAYSTPKVEGGNVRSERDRSVQQGRAGRQA
jgi:hypothetical protein